MVGNSGIITIGLAAVIGFFLMKSGGKSIIIASAALAVITLVMVFKGRG
ncbi:MAG: hypothetical protein ACXADH_05100 [Candidatus Kariarchaeaceae archaeon]|jgi:hypothetical protein